MTLIRAILCKRSIVVNLSFEIVNGRKVWYRSSQTVTPGLISDVLRISTARAAALIKKMVEKGLITREAGLKDARVAEIRMTEHGREMIEAVQKERREQLEAIIDQVGMDRLLEYFNVADEIRSIMLKKPFTVEL